MAGKVGQGKASRGEAGQGLDWSKKYTPEQIAEAMNRYAPFRVSTGPADPPLEKEKDDAN